MDPVAYFSNPIAPGQYFSCSRYGTMSVAACARNFAAAPGLRSSGRLSGCLGCALGRVHAGGDVAVAEPVRYGSFCTRCRRAPGDCHDPRQVGKMRLVRGNLICVSCYNREREVLRRQNAKGSAPRKWAGALHHVRLMAFWQDGARRIVSAPLAVDSAELALSVHRQSGVRVFGWAPPPPVVVRDHVAEQGTLFGPAPASRPPLRWYSRRAGVPASVQAALFEEVADVAAV